MESDTVLQAILLLCSYFSKDQGREVKPLSPTEYSRLATWLHQSGQTPADLLVRDKRLVEQWHDSKGPKSAITQDRLTKLLHRSASMGFALEKWQQQKLWIISRADPDYPRVLKEKLGDTRAPLLYCIGNKALLSSAGIGFVGSRNTDQGDTKFTQALAQQAVEQGFVVVSGGAIGVDQASMGAALEAGGSVIGVLADSLLRAATKAHYRKALKEGRLLLLTPYNPEASFSTGNAMGRNKYIYVLSKGVVVAKSDEIGGTWSGATENLKKQWVPLWVRDIQYPGNVKLIELGGEPLTNGQVNFKGLQSRFSFPMSARKSTIRPEALDLFAEPEAASENSNAVTCENAAEIRKPIVTSNEQAKAVNEPTSKSRLVASQSHNLGLFLDLFYRQLQEDSQTVHTPDALLAKFPELQKRIVTEWLKALASEGMLKREGRKLAFTVIDQAENMESAGKK